MIADKRDPNGPDHTYMFRHSNGTRPTSAHSGAENDAPGGGTSRLSPRISIPLVISEEQTRFSCVSYLHPYTCGACCGGACAGHDGLPSLSLARLLGINLGGGAPSVRRATWSRSGHSTLLWPFSDHDFVLQWTSDFDYAVLSVVVVATGLSETDGFQHRALWIIAGAFVLLMAYFLFIPGWGTA